jgi:hypothetical protein
MQKRSSKSKDPNKRAFQVVQEATGADEPENAEVELPKPHKKNAAAVALGRRGGKKGGKARAAKLTPEQRSEIARKAAATRWRKPPQ